MVADYTRSDTGATAKLRRKKTCASAQVGAREEYETVLRILTNQYLWDLDSINLPLILAIGQSQQPEAKCN
ncbi:hypothetical protein TUM17561_14370 [Enterobacter cloacae]|jgi:hypothetical protein|nr:hypothetical protein M942_06365 [Enterobacter ludwigii]AVO99471.1 hypothetical protein AM379_03365 [Enterobacter cloacae complex sp. FDA-CDC-AR_0132]MXV03731.1 hypothetical protein [Enterobacter sp. ABFQC]GJK54019.1 hypothetical protein TUM17561_14370 [Enterobacter cloacae]GLH25520.1 hypothetical protein ENT52713_29160 [Enterobacter sp. 200527-13]